jgi:hypothetical protein
MDTDTMTIEQFVTDNGITLRAERTDRNPNMADSANMDHWKTTLRRGKARMTVTFSMGYGHKGAEPKVTDVLDSLASDAAMTDDYSFDDWCGEYGYDTDSRAALKTYNACVHSAKRLRTFLGDDLYDTLLWHTERG